MQVRSRGVAILAAACVLLAHLISLRHETEVAHVRDSHGELEHAHALADRHEASTTPHLHGREVPTHVDVRGCALLAGLDHATVLVSPPAVVAPAAAFAQVVAGLAPAALVDDVLTYAPKTSPPGTA